MAASEIKEYLDRVGIRKVNELDTALIETYGPEKGREHIDALTGLFDQADMQIMGSKAECCPYRQETLVNYLNQDETMGLLAASFYDRIFYKKALEYLLANVSHISGDILDIGCGNGILTCFLAEKFSEAHPIGADLSENAVKLARGLAAQLGLQNVGFCVTKPYSVDCSAGTVISCRTVHENVEWPALGVRSQLSPEEYTKLHEPYCQYLAMLTKPGGCLISIERYEDDITYASFVKALEKYGFSRVTGTHEQFSCKNGDETGTFQANVFKMETFDEKLQKGMDDIENGRVYTIEEVENFVKSLTFKI